MEAKLWAERMQWDYLTSAELILRYVDARILPGYAAVEQGRVWGYSFFVYEGNKGVIGDLFLDPSFAPNQATAVGGRRNGHQSPAEILLQNVIATVQQSPGIQRIEAQLLVHDTGSLAGPFLREGFRQFPRVFMVLPLEEQHREVPSSRRLPDILIRRWTDADFQAAAGVITAAYRDHVDSEINDQYRTVSGSLRFLNNVVRFPGCGAFDAGSSFVAVDRMTNQPVSVLLCSRVRDDVGHITQVATIPQQRGRGVGELLIAHCARELVGRGFSAISLTVTQANTRAVQLYLKLGFSQTRIFDAFVWTA